jgi:hypothetical protein
MSRFPLEERRLAKPRYYAVHNLRKIVCTTQRAGSTSMVEALGPAQADSKVEKIEATRVMTYRKEGWPVLMWLRDPLERFASAYAIFGAGRIPLARDIATMKYRTPHLFADAVFQYPDAHWHPMTKLHRYGDTFLPTRIHPFYNLAETWAEEFPDHPLALLNETKRKSWNELARELNANYITLLCKHYEEDLQMLEWINEYGVMEQEAA